MIAGPLKLCLALTSLATLIFGEALTPEPVNDAYLHAKDFTATGLLFVAVVFLYRELSAERKKAEQVQLENKAFVVAQTESIQRATDAHRVALEALTVAAREQSETYKRHIDALVKTAAKL